MNLQDDEGSFTVEASMLLPILMFITMLLLFFCLYTYQKSMLLQIGSAVTERAAYNWDNSHKGTEGTFAAGEYDSLYWRIGEDGLLASLFGLAAKDGGSGITLPVASAGNNNLPETKLMQSSGRIPANLSGQVNYTYSLASRKVSAELKQMLQLPVLDGILADQANPEVMAQSVVAEPVEFIRTIDLMRYYGSKFKGGTGNGKSGTSMDKKEASQMLKKLH